uniref:Uncharacterized protein n=1 Tax=Arundo donax TaxID=35708 RepID=A0A0A8ZSN4_ARUDO
MGKSPTSLHTIASCCSLPPPPRRTSLAICTNSPSPLHAYIKQAWVVSEPND